MVLDLIVKTHGVQPVKFEKSWQHKHIPWTPVQSNINFVPLKDSKKDVGSLTTNKTSNAMILWILL